MLEQNVFPSVIQSYYVCQIVCATGHTITENGFDLPYDRPFIIY